MSTAPDPRPLPDLLAAAADTLMSREAAEAPAALANQFKSNRAQLATLAQRLRGRPPRLVATCARGSSDHAATYAKYLIETRLGVPTVSTAPSVSSVYPAGPDGADTLFIAISQSGRSPDLLAAAERAQRGGALVLALVNVETSPLAGMADLVVPLGAGPERSVAATKSYLAALGAILQLTAEWSGRPELLAAVDGAPDRLAEAWALDWSAAIPPLAAASNLYVLGRGVGLGVAQEMALKFKETCAIHAEAFSSAEVRHGPMAIVGAGFPVLVAAQDDETLPGLADIAAEFATRGADLLCAGVAAPGAVNLPTLAADPALQPILLAQSFYRMAAAVAVARGLDPDRPPHLAKVTETV